MKKVLSLILILLSLVCILSACSAPFQESNESEESNSESTSENDSESNSESNTEEPKEPQIINGIWYSYQSQVVLDLRDLSNVTYYVLKIGFYEYETMVTIPVTFENNVLTVETEDGTSVSWTFDPMEDTLLESENEDAVSYVRKDTLPTQYVSLHFPDFSKINASEHVQLGKVTNLNLPTAETLEDAVKAFSDMYGSGKPLDCLLITDRVAQMGDYVNVDYKGYYLDGEAFDGGEAAGANIWISENSGYIPGFAEGIAGHEVGSTFDVMVTFPTNYQNADLAGKETVFTMTLNAIYDLRGPYLWNQLVENTIVEEYPEESYSYFLRYFQEMHHWYAYSYGIEYELWLSMYGMTEEDLLEDAKNNALNYLAVYALVETYDLEITDAALEEMLDALAQQMIENGEITYEEAREYILENDANALHAQVARNVALRWLVENHSES